MGYRKANLIHCFHVQTEFVDNIMHIPNATDINIFRYQKHKNILMAFISSCFRCHYIVIFSQSLEY